MLNIYVGYDKTEYTAFQVLRASLRKVQPISQRSFCFPLSLELARQQKLFKRRFVEDERGQKTDVSDGRPFSTDFAFTRFLVPWVHQKMRGQDQDPWALFCDRGWETVSQSRSGLYYNQHQDL